MRALCWGTLLLNVVVFVFLMVYLSIVHLNLVLTFKYLTPSDVPPYSPHITYPDIDQRYGIDWFLYATDYLRFVPLISVPTTMQATLLYTNGFEDENVVLVAVIEGIEIVKFGVRLVEWAFCSNVQICRYDNPADNPPSMFAPTNQLWLWTVWFNFVFIFVLLFYLAISMFIKSGKKKYIDTLRRDGIKVFEIKPNEKPQIKQRTSRGQTRFEKFILDTVEGSLGELLKQRLGYEKE